VANQGAEERGPGDDGDGGDDEAPLPFPTSLCHGCVFLRVNRSRRGSVFLQCTEASLPKYGPQPVGRCAKRQAVAPP
jgi:hypothetical protein